MATLITSFYPYIRIDAPQVPNPILSDVTVNAIIEFCEKTWIYTANLAAISSVVGQEAYTLTAPTGTEVQAIKSLYYNGMKIPPTSEDELDVIYVTTDWRTLSGVPSRFYQTADTSTIHLVPIPQAAVSGGIKVNAVLKPTQAATSVPDFLFGEWRDPIVAGAKARLFMMTQAQWGDPNKAAIFNQEYRQGINRAKALVNKGFGKRSVFVRPGRWWGRLNNV